MVAFLTMVISNTFRNLWQAITKALIGLVLKLFTFLFGGLNAGLTEAFFNPVVEAFLYIANVLSWLVLIFTLIFYFLKIIKEERRNWMVIVNCFFHSIIFVTLNQSLAKLCFLLPSLFVIGLGKLPFLSLSYSETKLESLLNQQWAIPFVLLIAGVAFLIVSILRLGSMFNQMMIAMFYVPAVLLGDHQKVKEWIDGTVSVGATYLFQYLSFYLGVTLMLYGGGNLIGMLGSMAFLFGAFLVPKQLQKWGFSSGAARSFQSVYMGANMLTSGMRLMGR